MPVQTGTHTGYGNVQSYSLVETMAQACAQRNMDWADIAAEMTAKGLDPTNAVDIANSQLNNVISVNSNAGGGAKVWYYPSQTIETYDAFWNAVDSNTGTIERATVNVPVNTTIDSQTGKVTVSNAPKSGGVANTQYLLTNVSQAMTAASVGITLGKAIDSYLYESNPEYWDSIGLSTMNPETWGSITNGGTVGEGLFNFIFGITPQGTAQAYMDAEALAYMAYALKSQDWFTDAGLAFPTLQTTGSYTITSVGDGWAVLNELMSRRVSGYTISSTVRNAISTYFNNHIGERIIFVVSVTNTSYSGWSPVTMYALNQITGNTINLGTALSVSGTRIFETRGTAASSSDPINLTDSRTKTGNYTLSASENIVGVKVQNVTQLVASNVGVTAVTPVPGTSNQEGATIPSTSSWTDVPSTLSSLQSQYPDMFTNAIQYDTVQPDGSVKTITYVPVAMPATSNNSWNQPVIDTASSTQSQTQVQEQTATQTLVDTILQLLQNPDTATQTQTQPETIIPPQNPVDTGTGDSPSAALPTGSASALWSVYHPTQAQVNSFGAWLWGSPFLTNIGKLFQNPIDGVISLHKIFATPVDAGTGNIVVGTLDSGVSSATVTQQYVYIDCGSVNLNEDFANVFDYPPYTQVSLYLPFIGIVPLDTNDVMRSSINITYGIDVFTGACLAVVKVTRDGYTAALYQYSGVCAVEYPLSNVQNSNLVGGLLAVAGGVASMVSSGGVSAPAVLTAAAGAASASKSTVGRSGGFSGNAGAMGCKVPYLIIQRPQTRVASTFPELAGYPTNKSGKLGSFSGQVNVVHVHVENVGATNDELTQIENLLKSGVLV